MFLNPQISIVLTPNGGNIFETHWDYYSKPHLINKSMCIVLGPTPRGYIYKQLPHHFLRGKWTRRILRFRWQGVCYETVFLNNVRKYIHNISTTWEKIYIYKRHILIYGGKTTKPQPYRENCCQFFFFFFFWRWKLLIWTEFSKEIIKMAEKYPNVLSN